MFSVWINRPKGPKSRDNQKIVRRRRKSKWEKMFVTDQVGEMTWLMEWLVSVWWFGLLYIPFTLHDKGGYSWFKLFSNDAMMGPFLFPCVVCLLRLWGPLDRHLLLYCRFQVECKRHKEKRTIGYSPFFFPILPIFLNCAALISLLLTRKNVYKITRAHNSMGVPSGPLQVSHIHQDKFNQLSVVNVVAAEVRGQNKRLRLDYRSAVWLLDCSFVL